MRRTRIAALQGAGMAAALLLSLSLGGAAAAAPGPSVVGVAAAVVNDVRIKAAAARQFAKAALRQRVALADQVQTGGGSRLQLLLLDKSKFTVGPNARLTVDRFVYDPNGSSMSASVAKGAFRFMSGRSGGNKNSTISSPAATIGIRGTLLDGVVGEQAVAIARGEREIRGNIRHDPATATLVVLRGPGARRQGNDAVGAIDVSAGGDTVTLDSPLEAAYVPYAGAKPITFEISSPGVARLNDLLLEPRDVLYDPNAGPVFAPPERERRDYYDRPPPPGGFGDDDGPGPRGGYGPGNIPGVNSFPTRPPDRPDRPGRDTPRRTQEPRSAPPPPATTSTDPSPVPPSTQQGTRLYLPDDPPQGGRSTQPEPSGGTSQTQPSPPPSQLRTPPSSQQSTTPGPYRTQSVRERASQSTPPTPSSQSTPPSTSWPSSDTPAARGKPKGSPQSSDPPSSQPMQDSPQDSPRSDSPYRPSSSGPAQKPQYQDTQQPSMQKSPGMQFKMQPKQEPKDEPVYPSEPKGPVAE